MQLADDKDCLLGHSPHSVLLSLVTTSAQNVTRKLLRQPTANSAKIDYDPCQSMSLHENNQHTNDSSEKEGHLLVVPGVILLCCGLMFPCFHAERKEASRHHTATIERNAGESMSYLHFFF